MSRAKGGKVSLTAFEVEWLSAVMGTIDPIHIDALEYVSLPKPKSVQEDPYGAWDHLLSKVSGVTASCVTSAKETGQ